MKDPGDAWTMLFSEFNSVQHQTQTREYLYNDGVRAEKNCSLYEALEHVHICILERVPQCGPDYQKDSHMCDFLYLAVRGQKWAREVLAERGSGGHGKESMKYSTFHHRLTAAAHVYQLEDNGDEDRAGTYIGDTYAKPKMPARKSTYRGTASFDKKGVRPANRIRGKLSPNQIAEMKKKTKCNHCQRTGHWRLECPDRMKTPITEIVRARIKELGNSDAAVAAVLWEIVQEEEEYDAYVHLVSQFDHPNQHRNEFDTLLNEVYTIEDATEDLVSTFDCLTSPESDGSNADEKANEQDFW